MKTNKQKVFKFLATISTIGLLFVLILSLGKSKLFHNKDRVSIVLNNKTSTEDRKYNSSDLTILYEFSLRNNSFLKIDSVVFYTYFYSSAGDYLGSVCVSCEDDCKRNETISFECHQTVREYTDEITDEFINIYNLDLNACNLKHEITRIKYK